MAKTINTNLDSGIQKFTFTDSDGDVIASFKLNPTDVRLAKRCEEISEQMEKMSENAPEIATVADAAKYNAELEEKVCYMLGYDAKESLFSFLSATTILPDGSLFAQKVVERIVDAVEPEVKKRAQKMQAAVSKHTAKYNK